LRHRVQFHGRDEYSRNERPMERVDILHRPHKEFRKLRATVRSTPVETHAPISVLGGKDCVEMRLLSHEEASAAL
jgi:hypothetical protein